MSEHPPLRDATPAQPPLAGLAPTIYTDRPALSAQLPSIHLQGILIHAVTESQAIQYILDQLDAGQGGWVITPNIDHLRRCSREPVFRDFYAQASLVVADGMPLIWASRLQGTPLPQRVAGSNLIWSLSAAAASRGRSVFLLGGAPGTAQRASEVLKEHYPTLRIAGSYYPEMGFENDPNQMRQLVDALTNADPDIVYVALGSPKQERLIAQLRLVLPRAWWLGIGISFSFVCGQVQRAPLWIQNAGLEWLHRLGQEPGRLAKRYLVQGLPFAFLLLCGALAGRLKKPSRQPLAPTAPGKTDSSATFTR